MPFYPVSFYEEPLRVVEGLVKAARAEEMVILTLYSPFMMAGQVVGAETLHQHIHENPEAVKKGMRIITDSLMGFVKECVRLGLDGFYTSTQGGEEGRFQDRSLFDHCVRPFDLDLMGEINRSCIFNILHICDYHLPYRDLTPYLDYPGHVINASLELTGGPITATEISSLFGRPFMGGLERKGAIAHGSLEEVRETVQYTLRDAPERFVLAADCTVPGDTPWDNLRLAIALAHGEDNGS
jgi:uroporphyrinogen decarboxylase